jgi:hypothetical protein
VPRKRLTLEDLVEAGNFDPTNFRHRRALDESEPLADPELEELRQEAVWFRQQRIPSKYRAAETLLDFAQAVVRTRSTKLV